MQVGQPAPPFSSPAAFPGERPNDALKSVSLTDYRGKWLLFLWYPLDFTAVCPTELQAFSDRIEEFTESDCEVLGASCDSVYTHRAWMRTPRDEGGIAGMAFPLLADITRRVAREWGVLIEDEGFPLRALFLLDPGGRVVHATINTASIGRSVGEALRTLHAFQSGGMCGCDWKPGDTNL